MHSKLPQLLFNWRGRIARQTFFWSACASGAVFVLLFVFLETMVSRSTTWILYPPLAWIAACLSIKRLHDAGTQAAWLLVLLIPVLGPLWLAWLLLFRRGSAGENQYGSDPLDYGDYLTVDVHAPGGPK